VKTGFSVAMFCCCPSLICAAESYPVDGAWAALAPATDARPLAPRFGSLECKSFWKHGWGNTRLDFGDSADAEFTNVSADRLPDGWFQNRRPIPGDGEGGGRPGSKRKSYVLKILSPTALELRDGSHVARYAKCMLDQAEQDKLVPPLVAPMWP
jgi:hypothetical protein